MAKKRKRADAYASSDPSPLRSLPKSLEPRVDPVCGQRSAIPGLDASDGDLSDDASLEALAYLRSVRSEAQAIPTLLYAPSTHDAHIEPFTHDDDNHRGYYIDGAYIAAPAFEALATSDKEIGDGSEYDSQADDGASVMIEPQHAYHTALLDRFAAHRASFLSNASRSSLPKPPPVDPTTHPSSINRSIGRVHEAAKWNRILQTVAPSPAQLAAMSQDTVLWLLEQVPSMIKHKKMVSDGGRAGRILGAWVWALLGRLDDLGTLSSEEVSVVRELGKRAGSIIVGMELAKDMEQDMDQDETAGHSDEGETGLVSNDASASVADALDGTRLKKPRPASVDVIGEEDNGELDIDAAKARLLSTYVSSSTPQTAQTTMAVEERALDKAESHDLGEEETLTATLDMVLTIVGEFYGQRDLLIARDRLWERSLQSAL